MTFRKFFQICSNQATSNLDKHMYGSFLIFRRNNQLHIPRTRIVGVLASALSSSVVDRRFEQMSGQTKDYETGICYSSAKTD